MWDLYDEFQKTLVDAYGEESITRWQRMYDIFAEGEEKPIQSFSKEDFIRIFKKFDVRRITTFDNKKYQLSRYIKYLIAHDKCNFALLQTLRSVRFSDVFEKKNNIFYESYFASLNDLLDCVMETIEKHLETEYNYEYDDMLTAFILVWYDFSENEMPEILKADLDPKNHTVKKPSTGEIVEIEKDAFNIIYRYSNTTNRRLRKFGRDTLSYEYFIDSKYLFRSMKSPKVSPNVVNRFIATMKKWGTDSDKKFLPAKIRLSGLYYRIYQWEQTNGSLLDAPTEFKAKMLGIKRDDLSSVNLRVVRREYRSYNMWKDLYYGEDD